MHNLLSTLTGPQLVAVFAILGGVVILSLLIIAVSWSVVRTSRLQAELKRHMLDRGMSVADIERLTSSSEINTSQQAAEQKTREAQAKLEMKRDLITQGYSINEIERLLDGSTLNEGIRSQAEILADTIVNMIQDGELNRDSVARLIELFLQRQSPPVTATPPQPLKPARLTPIESSSSQQTVNLERINESA